MLSASGIELRLVPETSSCSSSQIAATFTSCVCSLEDVGCRLDRFAQHKNIRKANILGKEVRNDIVTTYVASASIADKIA